jgi:protein-L-isoaspartate(D-aspartate) O-methyltransferase
MRLPGLPLAIAAMALAALAVPASLQGAGRSRPAADRAAMIERIHAQIRRAAPAMDDAFLAGTLAAMASVAREAFVPEQFAGQAYRERSLPIGYDQTISDPYVVALMTTAARLPRDANVLDVGTGSGYQAAVLARLAATVSSIEIVAPLAEQAASRLAALGFGNIEVRAGDGYAGWAEHAPFDAIIVAAGAADVPQPLLDQLKPNGRLVMPIGPSWAQEQIMVVAKAADGAITRCSLGWTMFVPLTGRGMRRPDASGIFDTTIPTCFERPAAHPQARLDGPQYRQPGARS